MDGSSEREVNRLTERVPVSADKAWLERVDDWSFANRIRSRSEAIRKLVDLGIASLENRA